MTFTKTAPDRAVGFGRASGKAILIGEHTVVHGSPAVAVPLPRLTVDAVAHRFITTGPARGRDGLAEPVDTWFRCDAEKTTAKPDFGAAAAVAAVLRRWNFRDATVEVGIRSTLPPARGLGFSAACAAAAVRAVAELLDVPLTDRSTFELVQCGEQVAHGRASGVDAAAVTAMRPIRFESGAARPIGMDLRAALILADTGSAGRTDAAVSTFGAALHRDPAHPRTLLPRAVGIIESAVTALEAGDSIALGARMLEFHSLLAGLGVSTTELDRLVAAAMDAGALGAKLTGGGCGGCALALADPARADTVDAALRAAGAHRTWTVFTEEWPQ